MGASRHPCQPGQSSSTLATPRTASPRLAHPAAALVKVLPELSTPTLTIDDDVPEV